jgi:hypothetical protein
MNFIQHHSLDCKYNHCKIITVKIGVGTREVFHPRFGEISFLLGMGILDIARNRLGAIGIFMSNDREFTHAIIES